MKSNLFTLNVVWIIVSQDWTGKKELADALLATFERLPRARFVITTMGIKGCVMLERVSDGSDGSNAGSNSNSASGSSSSSSSTGSDVAGSRELASVMEELLGKVGGTIPLIRWMFEGHAP